jgi:hypothetical protein
MRPELFIKTEISFKRWKLGLRNERKNKQGFTQALALDPSCEKALNSCGFYEKP